MACHYPLVYKKIERRRNAALTKTQKCFMILSIVYVVFLQKSTKLFKKLTKQILYDFVNKIKCTCY